MLKELNPVLRARIAGRSILGAAVLVFCILTVFPNTAWVDGMRRLVLGDSVVETSPDRFLRGLANSGWVYIERADGDIVREGMVSSLIVLDARDNRERMQKGMDAGADAKFRLEIGQGVEDAMKLLAANESPFEIAVRRGGRVLVLTKADDPLLGVPVDCDGKRFDDIGRLLRWLCDAIGASTDSLTAGAGSQKFWGNAEHWLRVRKNHWVLGPDKNIHTVGDVLVEVLYNVDVPATITICKHPEHPEHGPRSGPRKRRSLLFNPLHAGRLAQLGG